MLESFYELVEYIEESTFDACLLRINDFAKNCVENEEKYALVIAENSQPTRTFDEYVFLCSKYFNHLKNEKIYVNDKFYFDILQSSGFNAVYRIYGNAKFDFDLALCNKVNQGNLEIDKIEFKFQRLSGSRHDHNYYIMKFLVNSGILEDTLWSFLNGNKFYSNFNRFLGIKEHDYELFPEQRVDGEVWAPLMTTIDVDNAKRCGIIINCESSYHGHGPCYSEKLVKCALAKRPFIEVSSPGTIEDLHNLGFQTFPDLVNESYDRILDPQKRIEKICDEIQRLAKYDIQYIKDYIAEHIEIFNNNFNLFRKMYEGVVNKDIDKVIIEKTS